MRYKLPEKLKNFTPYAPNAGEYAIRLDANESFLTPPEELREEIAERVKGLPFNRYPDPNATALCCAFSSYFGLPEELVVAGNGSDELIGLIVSNFSDPEGSVVVVEPDFSMYAFYARSAGAKLAVFEKDPSSLAVDSAALSRFAVGQSARLLILSNPCNPTSLRLSRQEVLSICDSLENCLVVADEAYMDFSKGSVMDEVARRENLLVLKTCSKAFGMAGIRLGFAIAPKAIAPILRAVKSPYNVNAMTQAVGELLFSKRAYLNSCIAAIRTSRQMLYQGLQERLQRQGDITLFPTETNFVYLKTSRAEAIWQELAGCGIAVRRMGDYLRVTAGSREENERVIDALEQIVKGEREG